MSRTHTVSTAPAPALAPATIALSTTASSIIDLLHSAVADPNMLFYYNYLTPEQHAKLAADVMVGFLTGRRDALQSYLEASKAAEVQASEKTRKLWETKKAEAEELLAVYTIATKAEGELSSEEKAAREAFIASANDLWTVKLRNVLTTLDKELIGPFGLGEFALCWSRYVCYLDTYACIQAIKSPSSTSTSPHGSRASLPSAMVPQRTVGTLSSQRSRHALAGASFSLATSCTTPPQI